MKIFEILAEDDNDKNNIIPFPSKRRRDDIEVLSSIKAVGIQNKIITAYRDILADHHIQMDQFSIEKSKGNIKELRSYKNWNDFLADIQNSKHPMPLQGDPMPTPPIQWKHWIEDLASSDEENFLYRRLIWYVYPRLEDLYNMYKGFVFDLTNFKKNYSKEVYQEQYVTVFEENPEVTTPDQKIDNIKRTMGIINTLRLTVARYLENQQIKS